MHRFFTMSAILSLLLAVCASAQDKLPSNVAFRLKEADRILSQAERALESNSVASEEWKIQTAQAAAAEAREKMQEIEQRYGGQYSPSHPEIVAMQNRITKLEATARGAGGRHAAGRRRGAAAGRRGRAGLGRLARPAASLHRRSGPARP